ncbi:ankyrin repeat domain-containing protein [Pedobacter punctiformis]|uniref:Ankyrin repeat domain-containing protein n=1 Tax=Pedobacter punctiformis TaxID=3004097 RepID=A0ABT4LB58_9SPHI|nr:ankyrin repeat domain-containing protein [Pedobacter sp. HCMS5-2]MCZ4244383.1 ankyrin repeat domain-containing protein [Pedobacter sp. HCMS5-2]
MATLQELVEQIELHSIEGINQCFENGIDPNIQFNGKPLIYELISEYTRSPRFKDCVKTFVNHGLKFEDSILLSVLLDDAKTLENQLKDNLHGLTKKYSLRCAYTPLNEVTLLHICAEFNHVSCAKVLVNYGADVNAAAGINAMGFGGQTPIFHTVNQNSDQSSAMRNYLLEQSADLKITVPGLIWGAGYDWETFIPAVNPISYTMMGLLPQMHRSQTVIANVVSQLMKSCYHIVYAPLNVPNKYLG